MWTLARIVFITCFLLAATIVVSQTSVNVTLKNNSLSVANANNGDSIISPYQVLWSAFTTAENPKKSLAPTITMQTVPNGCSITFKFNNTSSDTLSLGKIQIGGIRFGSLVSARNFEDEGAEVAYNSTSSTKYTAFNTYYPRKAFSPVMVVSDPMYTLCFSMLYPVLDYKHNIQMSFTNIETAGKKTWTAMFKLNELGTDTNRLYLYSKQGDLMPGEQRTYTVCLRVLTNSNACESWLTGLQPYKDYFRSIYGGVTYKNDPRPFRTMALSLQSLSNATNPYGFTNDITNNNLRPDIHGFGPVARSFTKRCQDFNYEKVGIIKPTGGYWKNTNLNYPFKFTSHWLEGDKAVYPHSYGHKMGDAMDSLKIIPAANIDLGLWWGRAGQVMFDWDTNYFETLNPYNPLHKTMGFKELDLAVQTGATFIVLDGFRMEMPPWDGYVWLKMMRERAPGMKFITEKNGCDFLQTQAGMIRLELIDNPVTGPHYLADFLLPGTEKIIWLRSDNDTTEAMRLSKMTKLNSWGFAVANPKDDELKTTFLAQKSWLKNNPYPDLGPDTCISPTAGTLTLNARHNAVTSYLWSNGKTTQTISVSQPGIYYVQTTSTTGCIAYDTIQINACATGLIKNNISDNIVSVYPNPFHLNTKVKLNSYQAGDSYDIALYNIMGEQVQQVQKVMQNELTLYTENFSSGIYFLRISKQEQVLKIEKLIIQ